MQRVSAGPGSGLDPNRARGRAAPSRRVGNVRVSGQPRGELAALDVPEVDGAVLRARRGQSAALPTRGKGEGGVERSGELATLDVPYIDGAVL